MRSQLVGAVQGPLAQLVGLLERVQSDLVYVLEQRGEAEGQESQNVNGKEPEVDGDH